MKRTQKMQENRQRLPGKTIIGIDPAKSKHQAVVLRPYGSVSGKSFSFAVSHTGFTETLPRRIKERTEPTDEIVFAIEVSCALWQTLAFHLKEQGHQVVLVSPLATHLWYRIREWVTRGASPHRAIQGKKKGGRIRFFYYVP